MSRAGAPPGVYCPCGTSGEAPGKTFTGEGACATTSRSGHTLALPVIVLLRSAFGFIYLGPKSVFFAFSWAFGLFTFYAFHEPEVWATYETLCFFGVVTMAGQTHYPLRSANR